jgi:uncharacterized protein YacL
MKKKNPWITAILNFLFYGLGFIYIGTVKYIAIGSILFIIGILLTTILYPLFFDLYLFTLIMMISISLSIFFAVLGYVITEKYNEELEKVKEEK